METSIKDALTEYLLALGDDELILGHRDSQWCGHAPLLEEDIAFANLALDEIGHASIWYTLLAELLGEDRDRYPDRLIYQRQLKGYRNAILFELPNGDWAFSMLRQYLFDLYELLNLAELKTSSYDPLREASQKIRVEEIYHHRHTSAWVRRLGLGTPESNRKMQTALEQVWPLAHQLFSYPAGWEDLVYSKYIPPGERLRVTWGEQAIQYLEACELRVPAIIDEDHSRQQHTPHLKTLVDEMQSVARSEPEAIW